MTRNKRFDIELMRIIAAFFVIFNHTGDNGFSLFLLYDTRTIQYWIYLFVSVFCKLSVPLFFMIAGALLLNRQGETIKKLYIHRVFHISLVLVFWSFCYYLLSVKQGKQIFNVNLFLGVLYESDWNHPFWYLYAYIAFLISLPLLQRFAQSLTDKEYLYMVFLYIIFAMIIPSTEYLLFQGEHNLNEYLSVGWLTSDIVIFPLTGYFLSFRKKDFWNKKKILVLWLVNIAAIMLSSYLTYYRAKVMGVCDEAHSQAFHSTFVLINSAAVFVTCQYMNEHSEFLKRWEKPISSLGGCTFGVYLLHVYFLFNPKLTDFLWSLFREKMHVPPMMYGFILSGTVFMCGYIVTMVLKRIPILRKLVS